MQEKRNAGILKFLMCLFILVTVLFSYRLFALEADHDCCGEGCLVCEHIEQSKECIRHYSEFLPVVLYLTVIFRFVYRNISLLSERRIYLPLVIHKIRFNN